MRGSISLKQVSNLMRVLSSVGKRFPEHTDSHCDGLAAFADGLTDFVGAYITPIAASLTPENIAELSPVLKEISEAAAFLIEDDKEIDVEIAVMREHFDKYGVLP